MTEEPDSECAKKRANGSAPGQPEPEDDMPVAAAGAGYSGPTSEKRRRRLRVWVLLGLFIATGIYWRYSPDRDIATAKAREFLAAARHNALVSRLSFLESWPKPFPTIPEHLRRKQDHQFETREQVEELGVTAIPFLMTALIKDPNANVRSAAVKALSVLQPTQSVHLFINALANDRSSQVRACAAAVLEELANPVAAPFLVAAQQHDPDPIVRSGAAAEAMGHFDGIKVVTLLTKSMSTDADTNARSSAARSLGWIGDPQALPGFLDMLNWEKTRN
jgi:hypothetical protein